MQCRFTDAKYSVKILKIFSPLHSILSALVLANCYAADPFHWGVNGHPMNQVGYLDIPIQTQLDLVVELGAGWYRFDVTEPIFQGDTARLDTLVYEAEQRKLRLLPVLLPPADCRSNETTTEQIRTRAAAFAKAIASRYKGRITHWELGNEYDTYALIRKGEVTRRGKLWSWDGAPDGGSPDDYDQGRWERVKAEIMGLYEGVKAADPAALTIVNSAGWRHYGFVERLL